MRIKKIFLLLGVLSVLFVLMLSTTVFAATASGVTYTVTANNDGDDLQYTYQLKIVNESWEIPDIYVEGTSDCFLRNSNIWSYTTTEKSIDIKIEYDDPSMYIYGGYAYATLYAEQGLGGSCGDNLTWSVEYDSIKDMYKLIISGTGAMDDYVANAPWEALKEYIYSLEVEDGVTEIGDSAFYNCESLTEVKLPNTIELIADSSFGNCISLEVIEIPESVTRIEEFAFYGCTALEEITILGENINSIGETFESCSNLQYAYTRSSGAAYTLMQSLGVNIITFYPKANAIVGGVELNSNITELNIPSSIGGYEVKTIGFYAFEDNTNLTNVTLPSSIVSIQTDSFTGCTGLKSLIIPNATTYFDEDSFKNMASDFVLKFIADTVPDTIKNSGVKYITNYSPYVNVNITVDMYNKTTACAINGVDKTNEIDVLKWAIGEQSIDYFKNNGTVIAENHSISTNLLQNKVTLYSKDVSGNETTKVIDITALNSAAFKITYGQKIGDMTISESYVKKENSQNVSGEWTVYGADANYKPNANSDYSTILYFNPDSVYEGCSLYLDSVTVAVNKLIPTVITYPTASKLTYTQTLADSTLSGGKCDVSGTWKWSNSSTKPNAGTASCTVNFVPDDLNNVSGISITIPVSIDKYTLDVSGATATNITYGDTLSKSVITIQ